MKFGIAYDTETTGLSTWKGHVPFCYSTCTESGKVGVRRLDGSPLRIVKNSRRLQELFDDLETPIIMHNAKFDLRMTAALGIDIHEGRPIHDTMLMSHVLQNHHISHALKALAWELCHYERDDEKEVKRYAAGRDYSVVPEHVMDKYSGNDAERTMLLAATWLPEIEADPILKELYYMELDLIWTTIRIENRGLMIIPAEIRKLQDHLREKCSNAKKVLGIHARYGPLQEFNPNRPAEVRNLLFNILGMPVLARTGVQRLPSTSKEQVLIPLKESHPHPALDALMQYRSYSRGITMLEQYIDLADSKSLLHPDIKTCGAITSREACSKPNLMNVSKSQVLLNPFPVPARKVFRPRPGHVNFHVDYKGIEMRLMVNESHDERMAQCFLDEKDPHELAASYFYGKAFTGCTDKAKRYNMRNAAKNANYARPYGASIEKMSETLGLSLKLASTGVRRWDAAFPQLANLGNTLSAFALKNGYVLTAFGRKLHIPPDEAYTAINFVMQGTGAELIKRAQIRVDAYLYRVAKHWGILMPIHDELIIECPRAELHRAPRVLRGVRKRMIDFPRFSVPLDVDVEVSTATWEKLKEVNIFHESI